MTTSRPQPQPDFMRKAASQTPPRNTTESEPAAPTAGEFAQRRREAVDLVVDALLALCAKRATAAPEAAPGGRVSSRNS